MSATEPPSFLYKIVPPTNPPPDPMPSVLPLSPLDAKDGYIHLSTASQTPATADRFFFNETTLYLLKIEYARIKVDIKWEEASSGVFAHLYNGGKLGADEIVDVRKFDKGGLDWKATLENTEGWLS